MTMPKTDIPQTTSVERSSLRGTPASPGQFTGRARILSNPADAERLQRGDVAVCASATPAWMPALAHASAIVSEAGGALSIAATAARELRMPAVFAVRGATALIRDGQTITIDGGLGVVVLER